MLFKLQKKLNYLMKSFINSDDKILKNSVKNDVNFYLRNKKFGSSNTKSDDVVYDFLKNNKCDILVWVNPIAPLQKPEEIKKRY